METLSRKIENNVKICENGPWMLPEINLEPTGKEHGEVLVIGVGGSTLRLTRVMISENNSASEELLNLSVPDAAKTGDLFKWCADSIVPVLNDWSARYTKLTLPILSVSWSFPLLKGRISSMGKAFSSRYIGKDLLGLFNEAFPDKYPIVSATHDGTSSLIAGMHSSSRCKMALTLGTGVNINVKTKEGTLVNTEISMLGRSDTTPGIELLKESWDVEGPIAEFQPFEAKVGGLYLSQMATKAMGESITTPEIWAVLADHEDPRFEILDVIVKRAASLVAAAIYGLAMTLTFSATDTPGPIEVVCTGGVIFEPEFKMRLETLMYQLSKPFGFEVVLVPNQYGSEIGAAIAALTTTRQA